MGFAEGFAIFVMVVVIIMYVQNYYNEVEYVVSKVDGRSYLVRKLDDSQQAADLLAEINKDLLHLIQHMMAKYPEREDIKRLYNNYNPNAISEGSIESGYTSYSVNKGEKIILCIRQKDNSFVGKNILLYVAIHELAHLMTEEIGHTPSFWENFKLLLNHAIDIRVYVKVDFNNQPKDYCGIKISTSVI
jgi:predicted metal-dependent hydrolase